MKLVLVFKPPHWEMRQGRKKRQDEGQRGGAGVFLRLRKKPQGNWPRWALGWMRDRRGFSWCN